MNVLLRSLPVVLLVWSAQTTARAFDIVIENGTVYDGSGGDPRVVDVAITDGRIAAIGDVDSQVATVVLDAHDLAVAPGFINMLSWSTASLIQDGRSQGEIRQGVTLEVFGEGWSMGPLTTSMRELMLTQQDDFKYPIPWTTLGEYLDYLVERGVSPNVASFVGAATVREHELGLEDRKPTADELKEMQRLVRDAMQEGALGVGSSLIYAPGVYADTHELIALTSVAAEFDGMYISHLRSEGARILEALDELIHIADAAGARAEIYHLKIGGRENWQKYRRAIRRIERARKRGVQITADMYTYTAGSTGLDTSMPPWVQEGGYDAWVERLKDPATRKQVVSEMSEPGDTWENLLLSTGPQDTLLIDFRNHALRKYIGKTLAEVAEDRGTSWQDTAIDLVIEDGSRVGVVYFVMSEDHVKRNIRLPWMSFGSDAASMATEGLFLNTSTHPRAYGNFARLLGKYVRDDGVITLAQAIYRLTKLPATNLRIRDRGELRAGYFADVVIFDPKTIRDNATYENPHQYASGVRDVLVNGELVLRNGEHTGALPGRVVRGPGWIGWSD